MAQLKGGQAVIESLRAQGVDTVFGIISTHMMDVYDALYDHTDAIRFISTRHEHAAALMADGYARTTGKPGSVHPVHCSLGALLAIDRR